MKVLHAHLECSKWKIVLMSMCCGLYPHEKCVVFSPAMCESPLWAVSVRGVCCLFPMCESLLRAVST